MYDERCLKIIGANIKLLRTCRGISQGELAPGFGYQSNASEQY